MLRSLWLCGVYGLFLCSGLVAPFVLGLGYVWVDTFAPQQVSYSILTAVPVSAIMAVAAIGAYLLMDRRAPPRPTLIMVLLVLTAIWVTYTTIACAVSPESAWPKWNWAIKTIGFSAFMPFLFRSRVQIEAFLQIYIFSAAGQIIPYGAKTLLSGGSYHANLGLLSGNSGLAEGSALATVAIMGVPVMLWLRRHGIILPRLKIVGLMYLGLAIAAVSTSVGTYERTGLVALAVVAGGLWLQSRHKLRYAAYAGAVAMVLSLYVIRPNSEWAQRMSTITDYNQESSSLGRILVWKWTLEFVQTHPLGGGFNAYVVDTITYPGENGTPPLVARGKAFHNMYFEMLGEHGWPGLGLLLALLGGSAVALVRAIRDCRNLADMEWCADLAKALLIAESIVAVCGNFIGIAFQPEVYYIFSLSTMVACHVAQVKRVASVPARETGQAEYAGSLIPGRASWAG
jgi:probable O-glycosylation ligase (exosortase A-associated)